MKMKDTNNKIFWSPCVNAIRSKVLQFYHLEMSPVFKRGPWELKHICVLSICHIFPLSGRVKFGVQPLLPTKLQFEYGNYFHIVIRQNNGDFCPCLLLFTPNRPSPTGMYEYANVLLLTWQNGGPKFGQFWPCYMHSAYLMGLLGY